MEIIKTTKLTKYYGKSRGIVDLDLTVAQGEFFGFIGPNGAGKSTTICTLLGLIAPTSGSAMVFGKDITKPANKKSRVNFDGSEKMLSSKIGSTKRPPHRRRPEMCNDWVCYVAPCVSACAAASSLARYSFTRP